MIDVSQKTYQNILRAMLDRVPDTYDKRDTSPILTALGPAAYALEDFYLSLNKVQQAGFIQTAVGQALDDLAVIGGLARYPASPAVRLGTFNTAVPIGARFSAMDGAESINFVVTAPAGEGEGFQYRLTAEAPGAAGNGYTGAILPITPVAGLTSARLGSILVPGDDQETDDALRDRLIAALNDRPFSGNIAAYREDILAIDGVGAVQVYPVWNGGGSVKCSILGADWLPAGETLVRTVQNVIDPPPGQGLGLGLAPIGAQVTVSAPERVAVDVSAGLTLGAGYSLDQVKPLVAESLEAYLLSVRQQWGEQLGTVQVEYAAPVYLSRITAAIVGTTGVVNVANVRMNGGTADLDLLETGEMQQVPVLGAVTLSG